MIMYDVMVLGDGVIALSAALACHKKGYDVAVVSNHALASQYKATTLDPKVCAINRASENIFKQLDVWSAMQSKTYYDHVLIWDAFHGEDILLNAADCAEPDLGHIVAYEDMRQALIKQVRKLKIKCHLGELIHLDQIDHGWQISTAKEKILAKLIIGADGGRSPLRHMLGIESSVTDYAQNAIGAVIKHESPHFNTARQRFMPSGPLALLPLNDLHHSALVWSLDKLKAQRLMAANQAQFEFELMSHYQGRLGHMELIGARQTFPLHSHHANTYGKPGVLLVGDAAHTVHPLAGQGLNLGLMDVATLVDLMGDYPLNGSELLQAYTHSQRGHNERMRQAMTVCQTMFHVAHPLWVRCRGLGMRLIDGLTPIKRQISLLALGYQSNMPHLTQPLCYQESS
jgi:2-octaprenylphenol hydroxylase